jgi:hypothetical protein
LDEYPYIKKMIMDELDGFLKKLFNGWMLLDFSNNFL